LRRFTVISSLTAAGLAAGALAGCGSGGNPVSSATSKAAGAASSAASAGASAASKAAAAASSAVAGSSSPAVTGSLTVFAAASLQGSFTQIGKQFEAAHPGTTVTFSFGPSSGLATQINNGAPASVFASAAVANMTQVVKAGHAASPSDFARNKMEVAVPPGNPAGVTSVDSLSKSSVKVALCQPQVPCGTTAAQVFKNAGISVKPVTLQPDVKSVLTQVELGEVDAGMVYVTDVRAAGPKVKGVAVPSGDNATTTYPIATVKGAGNQPAASAFVAYVLSPAGQKVLAAAGFEKP
jgi:molybdate transport system substrate-binding protein